MDDKQNPDKPAPASNSPSAPSAPVSDPITNSCFSLEDHAVGIQTTISNISIPDNHDFVEIRASYHDWPKRNPEVFDDLEVITLRTEISYDGGNTWEFFLSAGFTGEPLPEGTQAFKSIGKSLNKVDKSQTKFRVVFDSKEIVTTKIDLLTHDSGTVFKPHLEPQSVAFDYSSAGIIVFAVSSASWSHTCSGVDRYVRLSTGLVNTTPLTITATYDGVSMSALGSIEYNDYYGYQSAWILELVAPSTTVNATVSVTFSGSVIGAVGTNSYSGVQQSAPSGTPSSISTFGYPTLVISSSPGNMVSDAVYARQGEASGNQTVRFLDYGFGGFVYMGGCQDTTSSGSVVMQWNGNSNHAYIAAEIIATPPSAIKTIDGLAKSLIKTIDGLAIADVKARNGLV